MTHIESVAAGITFLEIYECECGFLLGVDAGYLEKAGEILMNCPACGNQAEIKSV